ncbi:MFS transporter [Saccharobesus litoralis]|uniref:MFS transporter n=1 Tax=Saccharobesus litoralis TaxID=2172099 RepID=A0A2S0VP49_9ALTE|nr:sugar porter family MFS transporter [Saccharobesus litoralis]AWB65995.1 MFS transporter [Saccharobesus litoralis]
MKNLVFWSVTVAMAGFLFGFDTAVISGADKPIQTLWNTSPLVHGALIMSSALWGTVLGALTGSIPCDRFGRRTTLILVGVLYLVSALGSALATDPYTFSLFRFLGGIGVGMSTIVVPAYITEIAPNQHRGKLVALYQFQLVFGILIAFLSNYLLSGVISHDWRLMLGVEAIPAAAFLLLVLKVPESPRWLYLFKNKTDQAKQVLNRLYTEPQEVEAVLQEYKAGLSQTKAKLFSKPFAFSALLVFLLAFFNQVSGINFVIYFAPRIFELAGLDTSAALLSSTGIGLTNLLFTMLGVYLIDKLGRKPLMLIGSIGYISSLAVIAYAFSHDLGGITIAMFVFAFIASHAVGQGAVIWVFIAEIFPSSLRTKGQALGCGTHWVFAAIITLVMPWCLTQFSASGIFTFFAAMMILQLLFVLFLMPETKGRSLEVVSDKVDDVEERGKVEAAVG